VQDGKSGDIGLGATALTVDCHAIHGVNALFLPRQKIIQRGDAFAGQAIGVQAEHRKPTQIAQGPMGFGGKPKRGADSLG
jgi:hypothetical protein